MSLITEWTPRYLAYCAAHGHRNDPEGMSARDREEWPGGCMTGFLLWSSRQLEDHRIAHPDRWFDGGRGHWGLVDHAHYDQWLNARWHHLEAACPGAH